MFNAVCVFVCVYLCMCVFVVPEVAAVERLNDDLCIGQKRIFTKFGKLTI